jgi:hypothetical protein
MAQRYVQATMSNPLPNMSITDAVSLSHEFQEEAARRLGLLCLGLGIFAMGGSSCGGLPSRRVWKCRVSSSRS